MEKNVNIKQEKVETTKRGCLPRLLFPDVVGTLPPAVRRPFELTAFTLRTGEIPRPPQRQDLPH